jgi:hypothetical protein
MGNESNAERMAQRLRDLYETDPEMRAVLDRMLERMTPQEAARWFAATVVDLSQRRRAGLL